MADDSSIRLQKILSAAGVSSRRAAERLMVEGRVSVNGHTVTELGTRAVPGHDDIRVDGRRVKIAEQRVYLLLNKPRGYVTTRSDPEGRPTVLDLLHGVREYLYPVGRLDYDSEGLLLLTNDGELAARLMHPRHEVERVYEARVRGEPDESALTRLARGIVIDGRRTAPAKVRKLRDQHSSGRSGPRPRVRQDLAPGRTPPRSGGAPVASKPIPKSTLEITVHEGRSRQVRKMCEAIGHPVLQLRRVRFGPIVDRALKVGAYRPLRAQEVALLKSPGGGRPRAKQERSQ